MLSQDDTQNGVYDGHEGGWGASNDEVQGDKGYRVTSQDSVQKEAVCFSGRGKRGIILVSFCHKTS